MRLDVRPVPPAAFAFTCLLAAAMSGGLACSALGFGPAPAASPTAPTASATGAAPAISDVPPKVDGAQLVASARLGPVFVRKWTLANGLNAITAPDVTARSVAYATTWRVGSRDEDAAAGQTGLAHLCEHLMFADTAGPSGAGEFDRRLEELGGNGNATTSYDFTTYVDDLPPEVLDRVIRLEAERMSKVDLSPAEIEREREIVIEERLQAAEDDVDGQLDELVYGQAFVAHPYRWPIVGRMADLRALPPAAVTAFFARHYVPDRATVIVTGRFDEAAALGAIASAYGALTARAAEAPPPTVGPERAPARDARVEVSTAVPADRVMLGYAAPSLADPDRAIFDVVDELMTGGPSSRLYRALLVDRELASSLDAEVAATRDPGLWTIVVQLRKGQTAATAEELIAREVQRLVSAPVRDAELDAARNRLETAFWLGLSSSHARAELLGSFEATAGDFRTLIERGQAYARVTAADVSRVAQAWLASPARSIAVARPKSARESGKEPGP